jgi:rRNA maturation RNase YbeY
MAITYRSDGIKCPFIKRRYTANWIKSVASFYQKKTGDVTYIFCSDEKILDINKTYLNHDYYTDIITFDYSEGNVIAGDLFISLETVKSNSEKFGTDYNEELYRVMIHGVLHLCGFKDKTLKDKKLMRERENEALKLLFGDY